MSKFLIRGAVPLGILVLILTSTPARGAQGLIEEVIVTAQKREQTLLEVPSSVQSFSGTAIEEQGIYDLDDIVNQIPGGLILSDWSPGVTTVHMRGSGATSATGENTVGFYVDETPFSVPNMQLSPPTNLLYDLERVEVLRGPQGTLYGQGSMGGTIKYVTRQPDLERFTFKAQANASNTDGGDDNYRVDAVVNIPVVEDTFAIRVLAGYDESGGFGTVPDNSGNTGRDSTVVRVKALWRATDNLDVTASVLTYTTDQEFLALFASDNPPTLPQSGGFVPDNGSDTDIYSVVLDWDLGFATLISSSSYYKTSYGLTSALVLDLAALAPGLGVGGLGASNVSDVEAKVFSQELRLVSNSEGPVHWIVGAYYNDGKRDEHLVIDLELEGADPANPPFFIGILAGLETDSIIAIDTQAFAFFGEVSIDLMDGKLVPLVGLRYFEDDRSTLERFTGIDLLLGPLTDFPFASDEVFDSLNPRFNLSYYPDQSTTVYANIAKGFRSGTQQTNAQLSGLTVSGVTGGSLLIDPDKVWTYEIGAKKEFADGDVVLQGAVYYSDWQDLQSLFSTITGSQSVVQLGDVEIFGVEWDVQWRATDSLVLALNGAYTDSEFGKLDPVTSASIPQAREGKKVPFTPEWTANFNTTYSRPLGDTGLDAYGYLSYTYSSEVINYAQQSGKPLRDLTLRLGVRGDRWSAYVFSENLLNHDGILSWPASTFVNLPYPRKIGLSISVDLE